MTLAKCLECGGRGWHVGECHPRETCGVCEGSGTLSPERREFVRREYLVQYDLLKNGTDSGIDVRCRLCGRAWWKNEAECHRTDCVAAPLNAEEDLPS